MQVKFILIPIYLSLKWCDSIKNYTYAICQWQNLTTIQISYQCILKILGNCGNPSTPCFIRINLKYCLIPPHWIHYAMFSKYFTYKIAHIRSCFVIKYVDCHVAEHWFFFLAIHCNVLHLLLLVKSVL